jgi:glycosyltransferase involved in cell wall biosynthesis
MKITYLHQYFVTNDMSGSTRSYEFARRLVAMGHEVDIITTWREPDSRKSWFVTQEDGIKVHWLPLQYSNHMSYFKRIQAFIKFAWYSAHRAAYLKSDIVFATSTPLTIALPAVYASRKNKVPMVFEVRDLWPAIPIAMNILKNPFLCYLANLLEGWAYKNAKSIITLSPTMKIGIISKNVCPSRIAVIPNSSDILNFKYNEKVEENFRQERSWLGNKPLLVYAGAFGKVNNLQYAVQLAKALQDRNSDIRILLIGDGSQRQDLIYEAKQKGVFEVNLFFEDKMPKKNIIEFFSAATMCANFVIDIEETWANSANKFFDTLAAGKPIFLNHKGWMHDLISLYRCGLCMHGKSMHEVAEELDRVMLDPKWLKAAGNTAHKLAQKFFDRNVLAIQLEKVLVATKEGKPERAETIAPGLYK